MTRSERLRPMQKLTDAKERRAAGELAATEARLAECERKLDELKRYADDYQRQFNARVSAGIGGSGLRDYQLFLARLTEAIRQQTQLVTRARQERDTQLDRWRAAAQRHQAIDQVIERWRADERRHTEWREQRDHDERAQRQHRSRIGDS